MAWRHLGGVLRAPAPFGRDHPERNVGEKDDRRRIRLGLEIVVEPGKLLRPERTEAVFLEVDHMTSETKWTPP